MEFLAHFHRRAYPIPASKVVVVEAADRAAAFVAVVDYVTRTLSALVHTVDRCGCFLTPNEVAQVRKAGVKERDGDYIVWKIEPYTLNVTGRVLADERDVEDRHFGDGACPTCGQGCHCPVCSRGMTRSKS